MSKDLGDGWINMPVSEFEHLQQTIRTLEAMNARQLARMEAALYEIDRLRGEVDRLSRALSHS